MWYFLFEILIVGVSLSSLGVVIFLSFKVLRLERVISKNTLFSFSEILKELENLKSEQGELREKLRLDISSWRDEKSKSEKSLREEVGNNIRGYNDSIEKSFHHLSHYQKDQLMSFEKRLSDLFEKHVQSQESLKLAVENQLKRLQDESNLKLEKIRETVSEKLQSTLEKRLTESFTQVSERLEQVHKGLGEMQELAHGVGDLKRILSNVKTRGTWGEYQLGSILEDILTPQQYETNVNLKRGSKEVVEYAVKLPGRSEDKMESVFLPIDSKFPQEDYQKILRARESADLDLRKASFQKLEILIKREARSIRDKYINPPKTTSFAVMFLPTESLYAEVMSIPGLVDSLQREYRVLVSGPTVLAALLSSLSVGFRTLAIQKRTSEIWNLLGGVKTQFGKFTDLLEGVKKKLHDASLAMDKATQKSKMIERKLIKVEKEPLQNKANLLEL